MLQITSLERTISLKVSNLPPSPLNLAPVDFMDTSMSHVFGNNTEVVAATFQVFFSLIHLLVPKCPSGFTAIHSDQRWLATWSHQVRIPHKLTLTISRLQHHSITGEGKGPGKMRSKMRSKKKRRCDLVQWFQSWTFVLINCYGL